MCRLRVLSFIPTSLTLLIALHSSITHANKSPIRSQCQKIVSKLYIHSNSKELGWRHAHSHHQNHASSQQSPLLLSSIRGGSSGGKQDTIKQKKKKTSKKKKKRPDDAKKQGLESSKNVIKDALKEDVATAMGDAIR